MSSGFDLLNLDAATWKPQALHAGHFAEYARDVAGLPNACSGEFAPEAADKVIDLMADQEKVTDKGGTMRLGAQPTRLVRSGTQAILAICAACANRVGRAGA